MESVGDGYFEGEDRWPSRERRTPFADGAAGPAEASGTDAGAGAGPVEVGDVEVAVDKALTVDLSVLPGDVLAEIAPQVEPIRRKLDAFDAGFVQAVDVSLVWARRGHANAAAFLRKGDNAHPGDAAGRTRRATRLPKMPLVADAFRDGLITVDHVRLLGELTERRWYTLFIEAELTTVNKQRPPVSSSPRRPIWPAPRPNGAMTLL